jgi:Zn-dependent peptidase ImmA (M78 family)
MRANAFASTFLMPDNVLREVAGTTALTDAAFATLATDLRVTPSALAYRLLNLRLIDAGTCDRLKTLTAAAAARLAGHGERFAAQVTEASRTRPPGLLARDAYAAYESGATTLRPYANLLGTDVEQLRKALEQPTGTHDAP